MRRYVWAGVVLVVILLMCKEAMSQTNPLYLETPRRLEESYQRDHAEYARHIQQLQYLLSVRADESIKQLLLSTQVRIVNRGRAETFSSANVIYFDMAVLDLLAHFSDELSLAEVKSDAIHQLEFNLAYASVLNGDKTLALLDPYNTMVYTEKQKAYLWKEKLQAEEVIFDNILGFILAHEISHLALEHEQAVQKEFPDEQTRNTSNPHWNRRRREMELAADEMAARICLNAIIQPAQLVPWLHLNEIRRRYYGKSAEYPTTAQRIAMIQKAYAEIVGMDTLGGDLREFKPPAPHLDVAQTDYNLFLDEFRKVRAFRQTLLSSIDQAMATLVKKKYPLEQIASTFVVLVEEQRDLLKGAGHKEVIEELIKLVSGTGDKPPIDMSVVKSLLEKAGIGPYARAMLFDLLEQNPVDWIQMAGHLSILERVPEQFLYGLTYDYLLANTVLRWHPDAFAALQAALPEMEVKAKQLKSYRLDKPLRRPLPTFEQRVKVLKTWSGEYSDQNRQGERQTGN
jgi:hypothetical protein